MTQRSKDRDHATHLHRGDRAHVLDRVDRAKGAVADLVQLLDALPADRRRELRQVGGGLAALRVDLAAGVLDDRRDAARDDARLELQEGRAVRLAEAHDRAPPERREHRPR